MAEHFNSVELEGNVGKDEHKVSASGKAFTDFGLAVSIYKSKTKEYKTLWFNCVAFGDENSQMIQKGRKIKINGRFDCNEYDGKTFAKIIVERVEPLEAPKEQGYQSFDASQTDDDNIPF